MRVGILGCGHICLQHLHALRRLRSVKIVGVCDRDFQRATSLASKLGTARAFDRVSAMIEATQAEVVHVLTPPQTHRDAAIEVMNAGCHALVEKPMAMNAKEAQEMIEVARKKKVFLGVCHNFRFVPAFLQAKDLIDHGALGRILSAEVFWKISSHDPDKGQRVSSWMSDLPGGVFQEVAPHLIYLLSAVLGELRLVGVATASSANNGRREELRALLISESAPATLGISLRSAPVQKFIRIYGTKMTLHVDLATSVLVNLHRCDDGVIARARNNVSISAQLLAGTIGNAIRTLAGRLPRGHETLIARFYHAVARGESPPADGKEGLAVVSALDAIWHALEQEK